MNRVVIVDVRHYASHAPFYNQVFVVSRFVLLAIATMPIKAKLVDFEYGCEITAIIARYYVACDKEEHARLLTSHWTRIISKAWHEADDKFAAQVRAYHLQQLLLQAIDYRNAGG